jgi:hypothetical protein
MSHLRLSRAAVSARALLFVALSLSAFAASAHHGQDFLLVETPATPHPGNVYLLVNANAALDSDADEQGELEPALLFGATPRIAFEVHGHLHKDAGDALRYEATAPSIQVQLTDPSRHEGFRAALSAEYEIAREADAPDNLSVRLALGHERGANQFGANLVFDREEGGTTDLGTALGYRRALSERVALGIEAQGSLRHAEGAEALAGAYFEIDPRWTVKCGLGARREGDGSTTPIAAVGLVLRLHD